MAMPKITEQQKKRFKKAVPFLWMAGVFAACMLCAVLVWYQYLSNVAEKSQYLLVNDNVVTITAPLEDGVPLTQAFSTFIPVYGFGVFFEQLSPDVAGTLTVQLLDVETGEMLADTSGNISTAYYDGFTTFMLDTPITTWDVTHQYLIIITANYTAGADQLALKKSDIAVDNMSALTENGAEAEGAINLMIIYDTLGDTPVRCFMALSALFALFAAGLCGFCFFYKGKFAPSKAVLAFVGIMVLGLFYQCALPAFSAPDELSHYDTAYYISNQWLGLSPATEGATLVKRSTDAQYQFVDYFTDGYTYLYMAENMFTPPDGNYVEEAAELLGPYYLPYYLSAVGLTIGQLLGWAGIFTALFARSLNLLFYAAMVALSVKLAPFGQKIFIAVALLPISLHVGGSFSYDSCLLALSFIILALGLRLIYQKGKINWAEVGIFMLLCFLLGPLKMAYFPITFFAVFIPAKRFAKVWQAWLVKLGTPLLSFLHFFYRAYFMVWIQMNISIDMDYALNAAQTLTEQAAETAATTTVTEVAATVSSAPIVGTYTVATLLAYPGVTLRLVLNTFFCNFTSYFTSMLGGQLGYQDLAEININSLLVFSFLVLLLFAMVRKQGEGALPPLPRITFGVSTLCVIGILIIACFSWTLITYETIWGFQGRYLLPVLPLALYAMQPNGIATEKDCFAATLFAGITLNFLVLLNIISITFLR